MNIITKHRSPNFNDTVIPVEYVVLHYTATTLERTLAIFMEPDRASAHLVIDASGDIYEMVACLDGAARRAWHAGKSRYTTPDGGTLEGFNDRSIGIELVNLNGNLFPYTEAQYTALAKVLARLRAQYPALDEPSRIVGHEQIAGYRGKCDPGRCFDWAKLFAACYPGCSGQVRACVCSEEEAIKMRAVMTSLGIAASEDGRVHVPPGISADFFESFSSLAEAFLGSAVTR